MKSTVSKFWFLPLAMWLSTSHAGTICVLNCEPPPGDPPLPQILEIESLDGGPLTLSNDGLILLDEAVYNGSNVSINPATNIYFGLDAIPPGNELPETLELNTLSYTVLLILNGLAADHVLIRKTFNAGSSLDLTATEGVVVLDTQQLFVVPIPPAIVFFVSGLAACFFSLGERKSNKSVERTLDRSLPSLPLRSVAVKRRSPQR